MKALKLAELGETLRKAVRELEYAADLIDELASKEEAKETSCIGGQSRLTEQSPDFVPDFCAPNPRGGM